MQGGLLAFVIAFVACAVVCGSRGVVRASLDDTWSGRQKVHTIPVPRIGGIAVFAGIAVGALALGSSFRIVWLLTLLLAAIPAFLGGLLDDFTKRYPVESRLIASFVAAAIGFFLLDARITDLDVPGSGVLLDFALASFLFTLLAVGGFAHALNIVDGVNGLSGTLALLMLVALGAVAAQVGDLDVLYGAVVVGGAVLGFLLWNYPRGLIFVGDGGAYLIGFLIAELAVLLVQRNSEVSPWFALLLLFYPVWETLFSSYRRKVLRGRSASDPDALHLHSLVYRRLVRWKVGSRVLHNIRVRNSLTMPYLVVLATLTVVPAALFWHETIVLELFAAGFAAVYLWLYWRIVRFRAPRMLVLRKGRVAAEEAWQQRLPRQLLARREQRPSSR